MRLLLDATTALAWAGRQPVGTVRVERLLLADLCRRLGPDRLSFVKVRHGAFQPVSPAQDRRLRHLAVAGDGPDATRPAPGEALAAAGRPGMVRAARRGLRRWLEQAAPRGRAVPDRLPEGHTDLLLLGHGWDHLDHDGLDGLRTRLGLRVHAFVHDLIAVDFPHFFHEPAQAHRLHRHHAALCRMAHGLIANSQATLGALERFIARERLPAPRLHLAPLPGCALDTSPEADGLPPGLGEEPFVLYVSTLEIRKNHRLLLRLWSEWARAGESVPRLVLVGRVGWGVDEALRLLRHDPALANVRLLENVTDAQLAALYRHCLFTLYPSYVEGWGWPISESLALGRPCLHADDPAQREAAQGLMPCCHPDDYRAWQREILALARDEAWRAALTARLAAAYRPRSPAQFCADVGRAIGLDYAWASEQA
ncbi:MAG: glycosyltransferase [Geminicoccaceae bacterium]